VGVEPKTWFDTLRNVTEVVTDLTGAAEKKAAQAKKNLDDTSANLTQIGNQIKEWPV